MTRRGVAAGALAALLLLPAACGEPELAIDVPPRQGHVADLASILTDDGLPARLEALAAAGLDIGVLTYTTEVANCGEAFRAGGALVEQWAVDVAIVAVARPGDFDSTAADRERCVGLRPRDEFAVSGSLREEIAETIVPPIAAENRWDDVVAVTVDRLEEELIEP